MKIPAGWDLPRAIRVQLGQRSGRQRALMAEGHFVLVLHEPPTSKAKERDAVYFWRPPSGEWKSTERGQAKPALEKLIDRYEAAIVELEEKHEASVSASQKFAVLERIAPLNRAARNFTNALIDARDHSESEDAVAELQPACDASTDAARAAELLQTDARHALDFHIAYQSEIQASHSRELERATHRLNSIATMFLPVTAVASIFGMNLRSGLESAPPWMFWGILLGSTSIGLIFSELLAAVRLRRHNRS